VKSLKILTEGNLNLHKFLGLSKDMRAGYDTIKVVLDTKSEGTQEELEELLNIVKDTSPLLDILKNPVDVSLNLVKI